MQEFLINTYTGGVLIMVLGFIPIAFAKMNQKKDDPLNNSVIKGWAAGIPCFVIGFLIIVRIMFNL